MKKFHWITISIIGLIILIVGLVNLNSWEKDFTLTYIGIDRVLYGDEETIRYNYEIKNNTNRTLKDVVVVFECQGGYPIIKWKYEEPLTRIMHPKETEEIKVTRKEMESVRNEEFLYFTAEIVKIKYK